MDAKPAAQRTLYLGVDGGGTGCRARIETAEGVVLGRGLAGPAATRFGIEKSWAAIEAAWRGAMQEADLTEADMGATHAGVGVAGLGREGAREALAAMPHPFASIRFAGDGTVACLGAHNGADGGIVIVGTGSCGVALIDGAEVKIGGYGFPVSDEGSGAYLGLRAIRMAMLSYDGRLNATALLDEVLKRFGREPRKVVAWMDGATATDYATLAPLVVRHADQGDAAARRLMQEAAAKIEGICRGLLAKGAPRIALIGGLGSVMESWLPPDLRRRLSTPVGDAMDGSAILAGRSPTAVREAPGQGWS